MEILSYGGFSLDGSEGIRATLLARGGSGALNVSPQVRSISDSLGRLVGRTIEPRTLVVRVQPVGNLRADPLRAIVARAFPVGSGLQPLVAQRPDSTVVQILAEVLSVDLSPDDSPFLRPVVKLLCPDPYWRAVTESSGSGPTLSVGGNVAARPRIVVPGTSGTPCTRRRYAVTDRTGRGLGGYPVLLDAEWNTAAGNTVVVQNGLMVPFRVAGGLWTRVDIPPNGTTYVDVYYGGGIVNTVTADTLDDGGLDLAQSDNTTWRWYAIRAGRNPLAASGAWRFGRTVNHPQQRDYRFGVVSDGESAAGLAAADTIFQEFSTLVDDYDSVVLVTGVEIASVSVTYWATSEATAHGQASRQYSSAPGSSISERVEWELYHGVGFVGLARRLPGSPEWQEVGERKRVSTYAKTDIFGGYQELDFPSQGSLWASFGAAERPVALALRVLPGPIRRLGGSSTTYATETTTYTWTSWATTAVHAELRVPVTVTLDSTRTPLVSVVETVPARLLDGTILVATTGEWIELEELYTDQVDLTLDCDERRVAVASGPFYARGLRFSDGARWLELPPGSVSVSSPWPVTWYWRERWLV